MTTAEEGGATANTTTSSYGGGAGGKFRKKPLRRPMTPYDRPPTALRGNSDNNSSWLKRIVVEPASKLLSYGAERFFAPLLRKRLPPPSPPHAPEAKADVSDGIQGAALNCPSGPQEPICGDCNQPINCSRSNDISELEQLLKRRTFTRSEIAHLKELLKSRAAEASLEDVSKKNEDSASDDVKDKKFVSGLLEDNRNGWNRSSNFMSTPIINSKVVENDNASPAELAKAYMESNPLKVAPSVLGIRSRVGKGDDGLFGRLPSASKPPIMPLTKKTHNSTTASENGFTTPRSRGRAAIYNMARTPYSKGSGVNRNGYAGPGPGPSASSSFFSPVDIDGKFDTDSMSLKRRSSVLDDELGFIGPIRRIRQKPNLLPSGLHKVTHGVGIGSHAKQKFPSIREQSHKASMDVGENENGSVPISNYPSVPSKSSEVASKILQHLEKMTPQDKSSEFKLGARKEKTPLTLTPSMLSGQALRSMEDVDSSKLLGVRDDHKLIVSSNFTLADAHDFSMQNKEQIEENGRKENVNQLDKLHPVLNNDSVVPLKACIPSTSNCGSTVKTGASHSQTNRAFRMSAQEDFSEQDDDPHCNGVVSTIISENEGQTETALADSKVTPSEEPTLVKSSVKTENQSALSFTLRNTSAPSFDDVASKAVTTVVSLSTPDEKKEAPQSAVVPLSVASDKPKNANNALFFSGSSKVVEKITCVPSESIKEADTKIQSSSSLVQTPPGFQGKVSESDKSSPNLFKAGDPNGKSDTGLPAASNGPSLGSCDHPMPFTTAAFSNDTNQMLKGAGSGSTSASIPDTSIFGVKSSIPAGDCDGGASANPATSAFAVSTSISQAELNPGTNKSETIESSLTNNATSFAPSGFGSNMVFGHSSSVSFPTTQASFADASKPSIPSPFGTALQNGLPTKPVSSTPNFNFSSSSIPFSSSSDLQVSKPGFAFGSTHSTSSLDNTTGSAKSTEATVVCSTSVTQPTISYGLKFSSPGDTAVGSGSGTPSFTFPSSVFGSSSVSTTTDTVPATTNLFTFGGNSSSVPPSSDAPSTNSIPFGASWQNSKPSGFSSGTSFSTSLSAPSTSMFNSSSSSQSAAPSPFSFTAAPLQPAPVSFGSANQMNSVDSMAEDHPVQQQQQSIVPSVFGQPVAAAPTPSGFGFGQLGQPSQFVFGGQPNQFGGATPPQNPNPFQASGSVEFNGGGSFSLGSAGGDKSGRKIVKISRSKNRRR